MLTWIRRWRKIGYRRLWFTHYGGAHEGDKGCQREYRFMMEILSDWRSAFESERSLRLEAEEFLRLAGVEPPSAKRDRLLQERLAERRRV